MTLTEEDRKELQNIRTNPCKMREEFLKNTKFWNFIEAFPYSNFKIKERLDVLLYDHKRLCHCGNLSKYDSEYCSITCRNKDPKKKKERGSKNSLNKETRCPKAQKTLFEKSGYRSPQQIPEVKEKTKLKKQDYYKSVYLKTFQKYNLDIDKFTKHYIEEICKDKSLPTISEKYFNGMSVMTMCRFIQRMNTNVIFAKSSSAGERDLCNWIKSLSITVISNDRTQIKPKELDIYLPDHKLAIEFNGFYWHSENKEYDHTVKYEMCLKKDINLLQFFEDEWYFKGNIVKSIILNRLGMTNQKVYGRDCIIKEVENSEAKLFLNTSHLQGYINGKHFGLYYNNELVSIITVGKYRYNNLGNYEIYRFTSKLNCNVIGGFSKLLKYVKNKLQIKEIYTFADLRISNGKTYEKFGKYIKTTKPNYFWYNNMKKYSRHATQKHKLKNLLGDKFDPEESETQNMRRNNFVRIFDCGNKLYLV